MEDNFDKIKNIIINIKNNNINIPDFNFIINILTNLLLELKANIVKIENDKAYYKQFTNSYYETNCLKTNQLKIWINKNIESEIKNKDLQSKILDIELQNEKLMKDIKELDTLVSKVSTNNNNLNNYYNKLNNNIKNSYIKLFNVAVPPNPIEKVCDVVPAVFVSIAEYSNSYTVLADSVTPTPNMLCAPVAFDPT